MTTVAKVTWRNTASQTARPAPAGHAPEPPGAFDPAFQQYSVAVRYSSAADWPGCVVKATPDRLFEENMRKLAHDRIASLVLDSRVERWCAESAMDPVDRRRMLNLGYTLQFERIDRSGSVTVHIIKPEEVR